MNRFFTKIVCTVLISMLCVWSVNAQDSKRERRVSGSFSEQNLPPGDNGVKKGASVTCNGPSEAMKAIAEKTGKMPEKLKVEPPDRGKHGQTSEERARKMEEKPIMRGPTSTAYGCNSYYGTSVSFPLNDTYAQTSFGNYWNFTPSGGEWINGKWYCVSFYDNNIYQINPTTGVTTVVATHSASSAIGMGYNPVDGQVYVVSYYGYVYRGSIAAGVHEDLGYLPYVPYVTDGYGGPITFDNNGRCFMLDYNTNNILEVTIYGAWSISTTMLIPYYSHYVYTGGYFQDLATDRETNTVYWASCYYDDYWGDYWADLYVIDADYYYADYIGYFGYYHQIMAFAIPAASFAPADLAVEYSEDCNTATLTWTAPSTSGQTFSYTGAVQPVELQPGTYTIECWGAEGGGAYGGKGGYSKGTITVTSPTTYYVYVGGKGNYNGYNQGLGGWNGGGNSGTYTGTNYGAGGGGGGTDIRTTQNTTYANRIIVAGGGGGMGTNLGIDPSMAGGNGGGLTGGAGNNNGTTSSDPESHGKGGTQTAGGAGGIYGTTVAPAGAFGTGGSSSANRTDGGGGGGWYGGGAGCWEGAGAGSGYVGGVTNGTTIRYDQSNYVASPDQSGNGYVKIIDESNTCTYNIYCDGNLVAGPISTTEYSTSAYDLLIPHIWEVATVMNGEEVGSDAVAKKACRLTCRPPIDLAVEYSEDCNTALFTWNAPEYPCTMDVIISQVVMGDGFSWYVMDDATGTLLMGGGLQSGFGGTVQTGTFTAEFLGTATFFLWRHAYSDNGVALTIEVNDLQVHSVTQYNMNVGYYDMKSLLCGDCIANVVISHVQWGDGFNWYLMDDATGSILIGGGGQVTGYNVQTGTFSTPLLGSATFYLWRHQYTDNGVTLTVDVDGAQVHYVSQYNMGVGYSSTAVISCDDAPPPPCEAEAKVIITQVQYGDGFSWYLMDNATGALLLGGGSQSGFGGNVTAGTFTTTITEAGATFYLWRHAYSDNGVTLTIEVDGEQVHSVNQYNMNVGYYSLAYLVCDASTKYNVYLNGNLMAGKIKETSYTTSTPNLFVENTWSVATICNKTESGWGSITKDACVILCDPPTNLVVEYVKDCSIAQLTWDDPLENFGGAVHSSVTTANSNNGTGAVTVDITAGSLPVTITGISTQFGTTGATVVYMYYRPGTACGYAQSSAGWTNIGSTAITVAGSNTTNNYVEFPTPVTIPAGQTYGFYFAAPLAPGGAIRYTNGTTVCGTSTIASNDDLTLKGGHGITSVTAPFVGGTVFSERNFAGIVHYAIDVKQYNVYMDGNKVAGPVTGNTYNYTGLDFTTEHTWDVRTICYVVESDISATATTPSYALSAPVATAATEVVCTSFVANWGTASGATGYLLSVYTIVEGEIEYVLDDLSVGTATTYFVDDVIPGTTYYYYVKSANFCTTSTSNEIELTTIPTFIVVANTSGNGVGTLTPTGTVYLECETDTQTFNFESDDCSYIEAVLINGEPDVEAVTAGTYTFTGIEEDQTIEVVFTMLTYTLFATAGPNGTIDPMGMTTVYCGSDYTFYFWADTDYEIANLLIDGVSSPEYIGDGYYTFENITGNHTITVTFKSLPPPPAHTIIAGADAGATITPSGEITVTPGAIQKFTFVAKKGYQITEVLIDDVNDPTAVVNGFYLFENVQDDHTIYVVCEALEASEYCIHTSYTSGGTISPNGMVCVQPGASPTFVITPKQGYKIDEVKVDGIVNVQAIIDGVYTFDNVQEEHTLYASFTYISIEQLYINASVSTVGGSVSPAGKVMVTTGDEPSFTFTPQAGYQLQDVLVDGVSVIGNVVGNTYTFAPVVCAHNIVGKFEKMTLTINSFTGTIGGSISPVGEKVVPYGGSQAYTITAQTGFLIDEVLINGVNNPAAVSSGRYTFSNVTSNQTIEARFKYRTYPITATQAANGLITPEGTTDVNHGDDITYYIIPNAGYMIKTVMINGKNNAVAVKDGFYTFTKVTAKQTITATFAPLTGTLADGESAANELSLYPNPTTGELKIENGELKIENIEIYDILGKKVMEYKVENEVSYKIDMTVLPAGIYFVRIQTETGVEMRKVIKN
ncbi:MAG: T9SS type A sorting domain-containing protein [Bacteroidales bacterium]|nr:T9SS type A sorting domain-containing protein [Bacteroidales bacterium]